MKRTISTVAVLGSGIMGSRIACHFANVGVQVILLDIAPAELTEEEKKKGLKLESYAVRNRIVNSSLKAAVASTPSPLYKKSFASRIRTGNFMDDMKDIAKADWTIEVVVENLDVKKTIFTEVEKYRKPATLVTSNTSGIPIHLMAEGRSDDFKKNFCGTHFFNPPRYLQLLEIIPHEETNEEVVDFLLNYGDIYLGKTTVLCKDSPAFIANRVGVYSIMALFHIVEKMGLTVDEVDKMTGPVIGRPKSATFRTCDLVGIDTLVKVAKDVYERCPDDNMREVFKLPAYIDKMVQNKWFGDKSKQGFYKKVKGADGRNEILSLDFNTFEYKAPQPPKGGIKETLQKVRSIDDLKERLKALINDNTAVNLPPSGGGGAAGEFYRASFYGVFEYVTRRIPEIADHLYLIDEAVCAGFGWEIGPFETWDALGVLETTKQMEAAGHKPAQWVYDMLSKGKTSFYKYQKGVKTYYDIESGDYKFKVGAEGMVILNAKRESTIWKNSGCSVIDIGDGIVNCEFHTKMNTIGAEIVEGITKAIDIAEKDFKGLVIGNEGMNFSAGANLAMMLMWASEQEFDEIDTAIRVFQNLNMRCRYSAIPVIVAPHGLSLGGGCEMTLHADKVVAAAETYIGLVEFAVGLIPGGGGTKEMTLRASDALRDGTIDELVLRDYFLTIGQAKVSTSAYDAFDLKILRKGTDIVCMNKNWLITEAKLEALELSDEYVKPIPRNDIKVLGRSGLGMIYAGANAMLSGHYISEHDKLISQKLGYVMCGGDLSSYSYVSEQYLLDLEREAFLSLCGERKTLERIQSILTTGKPLRN